MELIFASFTRLLNLVAHEFFDIGNFDGMSSDQSRQSETRGPGGARSGFVTQICDTDCPKVQIGPNSILQAQRNLKKPVVID